MPKTIGVLECGLRLADYQGHIGVLHIVKQAVQDQFCPANIPSMPHLSNALLDFSLTDCASTIVSEFAGQAEEFVAVEGVGLLTVASPLCNAVARNKRLNEYS
jgi:hypothetical protein